MELTDEPATGLRHGDIVVPKHHPAMKAKVIELRGPLGPNGEQVYRIRFGRKFARRQAEILASEVRLLRRATPTTSIPPG